MGLFSKDNMQEIQRIDTSGKLEVNIVPSVRAKFLVVSKEPFNDGFTIHLRAVYDGSEENKDFFKYTPAGNISLSTVNNSAADKFEMNQEYYVDFTKAN